MGINCVIAWTGVYFKARCDLLEALAAGDLTSTGLPYPYPLLWTIDDGKGKKYGKVKK